MAARVTHPFADVGARMRSAIQRNDAIYGRISQNERDIARRLQNSPDRAGRGVRPVAVADIDVLAYHRGIGTAGSRRIGAAKRQTPVCYLRFVDDVDAARIEVDVVDAVGLAASFG